MGKLQRTSSQHNISIFDVLAEKHTSIEDRTPEMKEVVQKESAFNRNFEEVTSSNKLTHNSIDEIDLIRGRNSIRSARCGNISNEGSSNNAMGVAGKNSIVDPGYLDRIADAMTSREKTLAEKASIEAIRSDRDATYIANSSPKIGEDEEFYLSQRTSSVVSNAQEANRNGWVPNGSISMFDDMDFERVKPTLGEQMEKKEATSDDSWQKVAKNVTAKDKGIELFDKMADTHENDYRNHHQDATDRMFEIFKARNEG